MRPLLSKTNVQPADSDYPFGRIKDNTGSGNGTPVNENVYGDFHQFFEKLMHEAGITPNGLPDNEYSGFQLWEALVAVIKKKTQDDTIQMIIDGGGLEIQTGQKGYIQVPFNCTVVGWTILGDQSGSIVVDIWKDSYANFPPDVTDTITGTEKPTLSAALKNQDLDLSTWGITLSKGEILAFNVDSASTVQRVTVVLHVHRVITA